MTDEELQEHAITHLTAGTISPRRPQLGFPGRKRDRQKERERLYDLVPPHIARRR
jgi:hypothetical protein